MREVKRGGLIPVYSVGDLHMMMFMKPAHADYGGDKFQIAKGLIDEGETPIQAAVREGHEELGVLPKDFDGDLINIGLFNKMQIFAVRIKDPTAIGKHGWETGDTKWLTPEQFAQEGRDIHRFIVDITAKKLGLIK